MEETAILDALRDVREKIEQWEEDGVCPSDRGYQDLLEKEASLEAELQSLQGQDEPE